MPRYAPHVRETTLTSKPTFEFLLKLRLKNSHVSHVIGETAFKRWFSLPLGSRKALWV